MNSMKALTLKNSDKIVLVDDEDFERLCIYNWRLSPGNSIQRAFSRFNKTRMVSLASEIMRQPKTMFDHIDRNPFNNSKSNLRQASCSQNVMNREKRRGSFSQYKGVSWHKTRKKWRSRIKINGDEISLGYYVSEEDAARAYDKKAVELFKEFACLNFK